MTYISNDDSSNECVQGPLISLAIQNSQSKPLFVKEVTASTDEPEHVIVDNFPPLAHVIVDSSATHPVTISNVPHIVVDSAPITHVVVDNPTTSIEISNIPHVVVDSAPITHVVVDNPTVVPTSIEISNIPHVIVDNMSSPSSSGIWTMRSYNHGTATRTVNNNTEKVMLAIRLVAAGRIKLASLSVLSSKYPILWELYAEATYTASGWVAYTSKISVNDTGTGIDVVSARLLTSGYMMAESGSDSYLSLTDSVYEEFTSLNSILTLCVTNISGSNGLAQTALNWMEAAS